MGQHALNISMAFCLLVSALHAQEQTIATTSISAVLDAPASLEQRLRKLPTPEEMLAAIKPGMTSLEVRSVLEERRPGSGWGNSSISYSKLTAFQRYRLGDDGICLLVRFDGVKDPHGNIKDDDRVGEAK